MKGCKDDIRGEVADTGSVVGVSARIFRLQICARVEFELKAVFRGATSVSRPAFELHYASVVAI